MLRDDLHLDRVSQVRLVGAVFAHRSCIRDHREFGGDGLAFRELLEHAAHDRLNRVEHVFLGDEAHFDVELIEFAGRAIGARIFVAETWRNLEIAVEAGHHRQLLELLRSLRQRIELARMQTRRHQEVARAFRRGSGQDRGLELEEPLVFHPLANRIDDLPALDDVLVQLVAAKIEEAVLKPDIFRIFLLAEYRHGQFCRGPKHLDLGGVDLDKPRCQLRVLGAGGTLAQFAVDPHHPFRTQLFRHLERRRIRVGNALRQAVMIAQIDEQNTAMVANAMAPAG
jgi:hypothetical protein